MLQTVHAYTVRATSVVVIAVSVYTGIYSVLENNSWLSTGFAALVCFLLAAGLTGSRFRFVWLMWLGLFLSFMSTDYASTGTHRGQIALAGLILFCDLLLLVRSWPDRHRVLLALFYGRNGVAAWQNGYSPRQMKKAQRRRDRSQGAAPYTHHRAQSYGSNIGSVGGHQARKIGEGVAFGFPGGHISNNTLFGARQLKAGQDGEQRVGKVLEEVVSVYGGTVFHGLRFAPQTGSNADVDHALLIGNTLILIDSKSWKNGVYAWDRIDRTITRDGEPFEGGRVRMADATDLWSNYMRTIDVRVFSAIVLANRAKVDNTDAPSGIRLFTIDDVEEFVRAGAEAGVPESPAAVARVVAEMHADAVAAS